MKSDEDRDKDPDNDGDGNRMAGISGERVIVIRSRRRRRQPIFRNPWAAPTEAVEPQMNPEGHG